MWIRRANAGIRRLPIRIEDVTNPGIELVSVDDRKRRKSCMTPRMPLDPPVTSSHGNTHSKKNRDLFVATAESMSSQRSIGARQKLALPCQRVAHDGLQVVEMRLPFEQ